MMLTDPQQHLLDALKALPPNSIYADVPKKMVFRGFQLYSTGHVTDIAWKGNKGALVVGVADSSRKPVSIGLNGQRLNLLCRCKHYTPDAKCEHVVSALLMVLHLLRPNLFKIMQDRSASYRDRLLAGLMRTSADVAEDASARKAAKVIPLTSREHMNNAQPVLYRNEEESLFQVIIENTTGTLTCFVERGGEKLGPTRHGSLLPVGLEYLVKFSRQEDISAPLLVFLRTWGNRYPIFYRSKDGARRIVWKDKATCETGTELDASGNMIHLRKTCTIGESRTPAEIAGSFAVSREDSRRLFQA